MLNTININLKTDIKTDRPTTLPIKLMSQDKNNNQFILRFTNGGESVTLDDTYTVEVLTKFTKSGTSRLTTAKVRQDYATWEFDTAYITQDETVYNYVYVRKSGVLVVSADSNAFYFAVGLSEIDKGAGKVAETYDENYEKVLADYSGALDERTTERLDEAVGEFNQRGDIEIADWRTNADSELEDYLADRVVLENLVVNGDFSDGITGWTSSASATLTVANNKAKLTGSGSSSQISMKQETSMNSSDNYYYSGVLESVVGDAISTQVGTGISTDALIRVTTPINNVVYPFSAVVKGSSNITLRSYYLNPESAVGAEVIFYNILAINLTATFGAGKEPSKEWMDRLIEKTGYFDEHILNENWQVGEMVRLNDTKANRKQEEWITPTLLNGWTNFNPVNFPSTSYYKSDFGKISLEGLITGGANSSLAMVLPDGYRPRKLLHLQVMQTNGASTYITVSTNGSVTIYFSGTPSFVSLSGIAFRAGV